MDLRQGLSPALFSYRGIQYQYMAPGVFTDRELNWVSQSLRILSGLYGLLRPFDGGAPYRLEMQAKLRTDFCPDLYRFWGDSLGRRLTRESDLVLNLASEEYARAVVPHLKGVRCVTPVFGELLHGRVVEKGTAQEIFAYPAHPYTIGLMAS